MTTTQVIITGGGIGGAGAALMLGRRGISVTLLEREPEFAEGGFGLQLGPNIIRMLSEEGVLDAVAPRAVFPNRIVFRSALTGEELNWLDCDDMERRYGSRYAVLHRGDLLAALVQAAEATGNVTLHTSTKLVDFTEDVDGVTVTTEDGRTFTGQVLVGADGVHSRVRKAFVEDDTRPTGYSAYRGTIPVEAADPQLDLDAVTVWFGPGLHMVQYALRDSTELNQVAVFHSPAYERGEETWGTPAELLERFSADNGLHPSVVRAPASSAWHAAGRWPTAPPCRPTSRAGSCSWATPRTPRSSTSRRAPASRCSTEPRSRPSCPPGRVGHVGRRRRHRRAGDLRRRARPAGIACADHLALVGRDVARDRAGRRHGPRRGLPAGRPLRLQVRRLALRTRPRRRGGPRPARRRPARRPVGADRTPPQ
ncbi:FAD-dependent monooxygenase [Xylanimonas allomyrinae]|uniref:FAD-dependent monooxygenase n=1 Tax=Xylanimonas allomyrinae TaxID=2509459 RepID=UPI001B87B4E4|nr:FAD-dependent monooxygenase [Xylanimonas allomyrinae]